MRVMVFGAIVLTVGHVSTVLAEDCEAPCMGTTISLGLNEDYIFSSDPSSLKANFLQPEIGIESFIQPVENFKLVSSTTIEQVIDPEPGKDSTFQDIGAYTDRLYAELTFDPVTLLFGKIAPVFSLAAADGDGINGTDLAGNIDVGESLGAEIAVDLELADHKQVLTGSVFTLDRSFLARSYFTKREVPTLGDGGAGNTSGLSSASLVLDGCFDADVSDCRDEGAFGYRLGARYQQHGRQTEEQAAEDIIPQDEFAFLAAAQSNHDFGDSTLRLMGEASFIKNFEGNLDDAAIFTGIASFVHESITTSVSLSRQLNFVTADKDTSASLAELAVVYAPDSDLGLPNGAWSLGAAYTYASNEDDQSAHMLSLRLNLEFGMTHGLR